MTDGGLEVDTAFELVSNARRRQLLYVLAREQGPLSLEEAATRIVASTDDGAPETASGSDYWSVYVSLYQNHVPRLAEAGVVRYDAEESTVRLAHTPQARRVVRLLGYDLGRTWRRHYLAALAPGLAAGAAAAAGLLPGPAWLAGGLGLCAGLLAVAAVQYATRHRIPAGGTFDEIADP